MQDKRKREITAIKQELEFLNKRMENTVGKKVEGESKPYFQLPSRKSTVNPSSVAFLQQEQPKIAVHAPNNDPVAETSGSKSFFSNYAKGPETNNTGNSSNGVGQFNIETKPQQPPVMLANNPVKTEGGMFKKKNPYLSD